jgi:hypothetical protein
VSAHDAMVALARDLVEEIAAGRALELAAFGQGPPAAQAAPVTPEMVPPPKTGAGAVYPQLGANLVRTAGDTISGLAYVHMQPPVPPAPPGQPGQPPIAGQ